MPPKINQKRRSTPAVNPTSEERPAKRSKRQDARTIATQPNDAAFKDGAIDVGAFIKAREFEIRALEASILGSRKATSTRAHQSLPRDLRRRTASHNVKRLPQRMRPRARKEMREDNTPVVKASRRRPDTSRGWLRAETAKRLEVLGERARQKREKKASNTSEVLGVDPNYAVHVEPRKPRIKMQNGALSCPPKPPSKFRKRQLNKTWLPTHMFHSKRARMTEPKAPFWRFALPLTPTEKSYRPTHRASELRGAVGWDTSYMSTIGLQSSEESITSLLQLLGVVGDEAWGRKGAKWRKGVRSWQGWVYENVTENPIAPVTIIWCAQGMSESSDISGAGAANKTKHGSIKSGAGGKRAVMIRVHPSAFLQLWTKSLQIGKRQRPQVMVEDLRFEIGSIEITGPGSTEALQSTLWPFGITNKLERSSHTPAGTWISLRALTNPASLVKGALLAFEISDPRLHHPPRPLERSQPPELDEERLLETLRDWPLDVTQGPAKIFSQDARLEASRGLASQKSINRRKGLAPAGHYPTPIPHDPNIPILLLASRNKSGHGGQGSWTVLIPWKCVLPVWYMLMHIPLSTGGSPRFGGLRETRQLSFEQGKAWFPGDFPGTKAGWAWELVERERRKAEWDRRPKGKRVEWSSLNLGNGKKGELGEGWACAWERLIDGPPPDAPPSRLTPKDTAIKDDTVNADNEIPEGVIKPSQRLYHLCSSEFLELLKRSKASAANLTKTIESLKLNSALTTVKLTLLPCGTSPPCSRIYRLPSRDRGLYKRWVSLLVPRNQLARTSKRDIGYFRPKPSDPPEVRRQKLAASLLGIEVGERAGPPKPGDKTYPVVPGEEDLIGFVTEGGFNLSEGIGIGIGSVLVSKVLAGEGKGSEMFLCIVREAGQQFGRLARWESIS